MEAEPYVCAMWRTGALAATATPSSTLRAAPQGKSGEQHERSASSRAPLEKFTSGRVLPHEKTLASRRRSPRAPTRLPREPELLFGLFAPGFSLVEAVRTRSRISPSDFTDAPACESALAHH